MQQKRGGGNVLQDNGLRSERANACCTRVAMRRQSACELVRFSRAPRRLFRPQPDTIATRKNLLCEHVCWGHVGIAQHDQNQNRRMTRRKRETARNECWLTPIRKGKVFPRCCGVRNLTGGKKAIVPTIVPTSVLEDEQERNDGHDLRL